MSGAAEHEAAEVELIRTKAQEVRQRVEAAADGDRPVRIVAVTKAFPIEVSQRALAAGLTDLGENYAQELVSKDDHPSTLGARWHFIGGLQRNKVKLLAGRVHLWQTVDRDSLVDELAKRCPANLVLIQVNTTDEPQKAGCEPGEAEGLVERARLAGLGVQGLMTVGPTSPSTDPRPAFSALRELAERCEVAELSMGMSGDFELAVAEGATMIRVGSVLFGSRPPR